MKQILTFNKLKPIYCMLEQVRHIWQRGRHAAAGKLHTGLVSKAPELLFPVKWHHLTLCDLSGHVLRHQP